MEKNMDKGFWVNPSEGRLHQMSSLEKGNVDVGEATKEKLKLSPEQRRVALDQIFEVIKKKYNYPANSIPGEILSAVSKKYEELQEGGHEAGSEQAADYIKQIEQI